MGELQKETENAASLPSEGENLDRADEQRTRQGVQQRINRPEEQRAAASAQDPGDDPDYPRAASANEDFVKDVSMKYDDDETRAAQQAHP
ncbi:MAG: hypothetical protein ACYDAG_02875 [Chloroflexota bacterium]